MPDLTRRAVISAMAAAPSAALAGSSDSTQPQPTPSEALELLKAGNRAFTEAGACVETGGPERVAALSAGQHPFAVILGCADSRTPPEHIFARGLGELFVVRVAGNTLDTSGLGSIEYAVAALGVPLVLVLGHSHCGAVEAAVRIATQQQSYPGAIGEMVEPILPAVETARASGADDLISASVEANVAQVASDLSNRSPLLADRLEEGRLLVAGGVYDLASGRVTFLA